jgi:hypothetical protein
MRLFSLLLLSLLLSCGGVVPEETCTSNDECFENYVCAAAETGSSENICLRACSVDTDCLTSQVCDTTSSACRMDTSTDES